MPNCLAAVSPRKTRPHVFGTERTRLWGAQVCSMETGAAWNWLTVPVGGPSSAHIRGPHSADSKVLYRGGPPNRKTTRSRVGIAFL